MRLNDSNSGKKKPTQAPSKPPQGSSQGRPSGVQGKAQNPDARPGAPKSSPGSSKPRSAGGSRGSGAAGGRGAAGGPGGSGGGPSRRAPNGSTRSNAGRPSSSGRGTPTRGSSAGTGRDGSRSRTAPEERKRRSSSSSGSGSKKQSTQKPEAKQDFNDIVKHTGDLPKGATNKPVKKKQEKKLTPEQEKRKAFFKKARLVGIAAVVIIALVVGGNFVFKRFISPEIAETPEALSGAGSFKSWMDAVNSNDADSLNAHVEKSLIAQETKYAGNSEARKKFVEAVLSSVEYEIPQKQQTTIYGKPVEKDGQPVLAEDDLMDSGAKVKLTYVDWEKVPVSDSAIKLYMEDADVKPDDPDIREKLTDVFADYIVNIAESDTLPTKTVEWTPAFDEEKVADPGDPDSGKLINSRKVSKTEDANLDKVLFSGKGLWRLETKFSTLALDKEPGADWTEWIGGLDAEGGAGDSESKGESGAGTTEEGAGAKEDEEEESKAGGVITEESPSDGGGESPSPESEDGVPLPNQEEEGEEDKGTQDDVFPAEEMMPAVGNPSFISPYWIGSWFLQEGIVEEGKKFDKDVAPILPPVGDGSKESPAGMNTSVKTVQLDKGKKGKEVENPIRVELMQIATDQEALDFYQSKDSRNRGFTLNSQVKYMAMRFKVTNLSKKEITIRDNSSLSDDQINLTDRTGKVYGLDRSIKLKPGESGVIESWAGSPTLDGSYLIWGADFNRQHEVVWFRALAGSKGKIAPVEGRDDAPGQSSEDGSGTDEGTEVVEGNNPEGGSSGGDEGSGGSEDSGGEEEELNAPPDAPEEDG